MLFRSRRQLEGEVANLIGTTRARLLAGRAALDCRTASLEALSPVAILNRGYALVFDGNGQLVKDATRVAAGDELTARVAHGRIRARVTGSEPTES